MWIELEFVHINYMPVQIHSNLHFWKNDSLNEFPTQQLFHMAYVAMAMYHAEQY